VAGGILSLLAAEPAKAAPRTTGVINVCDPPYNAGSNRSSRANTRAIARAIADAPLCSKIIFPEPLSVAPQDGGYIKLTKPLDLEGVGWHSQLIPDPDISSTAPVISILGIPRGVIFHWGIRNLTIGNNANGNNVNPLQALREGGHGIHIETNQRFAGTENCEIEQVYTQEGRYGQESYGIYLHHSNPGNAGAIYNFTISRCMIQGGIRMIRVADSVRVLNSLIFGKNDVDIDVKPGAGNLTLRGNNVSSEGGFRLRAGPAALIEGNVFAQQLVSTNPNNALVDIDGDIETMIGVTMIGNRFQTEANLGNPWLVRCNNVESPMIWGNSFKLPSAYTPIEFTELCVKANVGPNIWDIGGATPWVNKNSKSPVNVF
jgi:hypothetical protein